MKILINKKKYLKNEKGFTLIEIIAVIVILGIMAAVAVPKFFSMQEDAAIAVMHGALAEGAVRFNHAFAKYILDKKQTPSRITNLTTDDTDGHYLTPAADTTPGVDIGDFTLTWTEDPESADGDVIVTVTSCTTIDAITLENMDAEDKQKIITNIDWLDSGT